MEVEFKTSGNVADLRNAFEARKKDIGDKLEALRLAVEEATDCGVVTWATVGSFSEIDRQLSNTLEFARGLA